MGSEAKRAQRAVMYRNKKSGVFPEETQGGYKGTGTNRIKVVRRLKFRADVSYVGDRSLW